MSWTRQLMHVLAKDIRAQQWWLLLYTVLLVLGTGPVWWPAHFGVEALPATATFDLVSVLTVATIFFRAVRADAPLGRDSAWVMLPLAPSAVFAAKLAFLGVLTVILPIAAQAPAWWHLRVPLSSIAVVWSASGTAYIALLIVVALFASAVRSGGIVFLLVLGSGIVNEALDRPLEASWALWLSVAVSAAALLVLLQTYVRRQDTTGRRLVLTGVGLVVLLLPNSARSTPEGDATLAAVLPGTRVTLTADTTTATRAGSSTPVLEVLLAPVPDARNVLLVSEIVRAPGCPDRRGRSSSVFGPRFPVTGDGILPTDLMWRTSEPVAPPPATAMESVRLRFGVHPVMRDPACRAELAHRLAVTRESLVTRLPAFDTSLQFTGGRRFFVQWPRNNPGHLTFALDVTAPAGLELVPEAETPGFRAGRGTSSVSTYIRLVLVHERRREAMDLGMQRSFDLANRNLPITTHRFATFAPEQYNGPDLTSWSTLGFASDAEGEQWLSEAMLYVIADRTQSVDLTERVTAALSRSPR